MPPRLPAHALKKADAMGRQFAAREQWKYAYKPNARNVGPMTIDDAADQLEEEMRDGAWDRDKW